MNAESPTFAERHKSTLMVLGKNIGEDWTGQRIRQTRHHLSPHSRVSVLAAGVALKKGLADEVIFTITNTAGTEPLSPEDARLSHDSENAGLPIPSEAELMAERFKSIFPSLADKASVQPWSWDTNTDAKEAKRLIQEREINPKNKLVLMTDGFHIPRAAHLFRRVGLRPYLFVSERILALRRPKFAKNYERSELYKKEQNKERRVYAIQRLPFATDVISRITKRSRTK